MPVSFQSNMPASSRSFSGARFPGELNSLAGAGSVSPSWIESFGHTRQEREVVRFSKVISSAHSLTPSFRMRGTETLYTRQECTILPWSMTMLCTT